MVGTETFSHGNEASIPRFRFADLHEYEIMTAAVGALPWIGRCPACHACWGLYLQFHLPGCPLHDPCTCGACWAQVALYN